MRTIALVTGILIAACSSGDDPGSPAVCGPNGSCPSGYTCSAQSNLCLRSGSAGDAGGQSAAFASGADWPSFDGDLGGAHGASLGNAKAVCVSPSVPASCPTGGLAFRTSGAGWNATVTAAPGAIWIWRGDVSPSGLSDLQFAVFEKTFTLGASPSGTIQVAADDFVEVRVNGSVAGSAGSVTDETVAYSGQSAVTTFDLGPLLQAGENTITIIAQNGPQAFGSCATPCPFTVNMAGVVFGGVLSWH